MLDAIVATAARLCRAEWATTYKLEPDGKYHLAAAIGNNEAFLRHLAQNPVVPGRGTMAGRTALEARTVHVPDVLQDPDYNWPEAQAKGGFRSILGIPLLRSGAVIGVIILARNVVRPFKDKEIELVATFADQAVIAIENVRLFDEVQVRTRDLTEALEQQTATSAILRVISTSPTEVQPVFETIVRNAVALCGSLFANVFRFDGELLHFVASHDVGPEDEELLRAKYPMRPDVSQVSGRTVLTRSIVRLEDALADRDYDHRFPAAMGWRRMLGVPMLRQGEPLGAIVVGWAEAGPVPKAQEELLKQFADQAVIAIENVRLFDEVQARTDQLSRSVAELRALGEVSEAVNSSLDLDTVLARIVAHATTVAGADAGALYSFDAAEGLFRLGATHRLDPEIDQLLYRRAAGAGSGRDRTRRRRAAASADTPTSRTSRATCLRSEMLWAGYRAILAVPLLRNDALLGGLVLCRKRPGSFAADTVDLVETLANQSALAIHNARLFQEIEEKGRQLEEASRHKSQFLANMSHELRTPMNAILGFTELIQDGIYGEPPAKIAEVLGRIDSNGKHLLGLINDVLDLSKIEAGQLELRPGDYTMADIVGTVVSTTEARSPREKGLALDVELAADLPTGSGDAQRLTQVVLNLVGNAIKFTDDGRGRDRARRPGRRASRSASPTPAPGIAAGRAGSGSSRSSTRSTARPRARRAAPGSAWPSPGASSSCTAAGSGSRASSARARASPSPCRCDGTAASGHPRA